MRGPTDGVRRPSLAGWDAGSTRRADRQFGTGFIIAVSLVLTLALVLRPGLSLAQHASGDHARCAVPRQRATGAFIAAVREYNRAFVQLTSASAAASQSVGPQMRAQLMGILRRARAMNDPEARNEFMERAQELDGITTHLIRSANVLSVYSAAARAFQACNEVQFASGTSADEACNESSADPQYRPLCRQCDRATDAMRSLAGQLPTFGSDELGANLTSAIEALEQDVQGLQHPEARERLEGLESERRVALQLASALLARCREVDVSVGAPEPLWPMWESLHRDDDARSIGNDAVVIRPGAVRRADLLRVAGMMRSALACSGPGGNVAAVRDPDQRLVAETGSRPLTEQQVIERVRALPAVRRFARSVHRPWTFSIRVEERPTQPCSTGNDDCQWELGVGGDSPERWSRWNSFRVDAVAGEIRVQDILSGEGDEWVPVGEFFDRRGRRREPLGQP